MCSMKKVVLKNSVIFKGTPTLEHLNFKNTYFEEYLQTAASERRH